MQKAYNSRLVAFLAFVMSLSAFYSFAQAQDATPPGAPGILANGDAVVTGFSGTQEQAGQVFINPQGASVRVLDLSQRGQARGQLINAPAKFEVFARDVGQVFGVALDNASPPNIYVTATSAFGLSLVTPDANGDGIPEKATTGAADAAFMPGQFGPGGGPGTIWKIDGKTGAVSQFANIENSVAGLGNIVFDPSHYQFFVSDLESGLIHRLDLAGRVLDTFDHGTTGRPGAGLDAVASDPALKADITSSDFDTDNSDTWGLADIRRRVWGLAVYNGRLYYSPAEGPQVWSVGLNRDGSFAVDARIDIQSVPGGFPVSDMLFTSDGKMVLSQRGGQLGSTDYSQFHSPNNNSVLRYVRDETGQWVQEPQQYAIGMTPDYKNASGGVGLACGNVLWSTGDALLSDPSRPGAQIVHGLQGNAIASVRPDNTPPLSSWFADYNGTFNDPQNAGHVGDVEIYRHCTPQAGYSYEESWPGWTPEWTPPQGWIPPLWWPRFPDLELVKRNARCKYVKRSLILECKFKLIITNVGAEVYTGPLQVEDNVPSDMLYIPPPSGNIPWSCNQPGGRGNPVLCNSINIEVLLPGQSKTLILKLRYPGGKNRRRFKNCARLDTPDRFSDNNQDCGYGRPPGPDLKAKKKLKRCFPTKTGNYCIYRLTVKNVGLAAHNGTIHVEEQIPPGSTFAGVISSSSPGWSCAGGGAVV
ncbi:MAG TPA: hypothetical protein ENJ55_05975, partial [Rhizobiales bacterium]|nr:hypothetical protein [Hyphomicrobiales bacterium]